MLTKTKTTLLIFVVFAVIVYVVFIYVLYHLRSTYATAATLSGEVASLLTKVEDTEKLKETILFTEEKRKALDSHFVTHATIPAFLETLERSGALAGTTFKIMNVTEIEAKAKPTTLGIQATASGSFAQVLMLLKLLETAPYEFRFTAVNFTNRDAPTSDTDTGGSSGPLTIWEAEFSFNLLTFTK